MNIYTAAASVGIKSRSTLYNWMRCGLLPYTQLRFGRHVQLEDVQAAKARVRLIWMASRKMTR